MLKYVEKTANCPMVPAIQSEARTYEKARKKEEEELIALKERIVSATALGSCWVLHRDWA